MNQNLRQSMSLAHASAMVVGIILGASIFIQPSEITRLVPSSAGVLLVWLVAGVLTICGALVCAELAAVFPSTGGVYVFLKEIFSPALGFLWGWGMFWSMHSGILAAIAVVLARYVGYFVPLNQWGVRAVAIAALLLLSMINYLGVKLGSTVQVVLTAAKLAAVAGLALVLFIFGGPAHRAIAGETAAPLRATGISNYVLAIGAGLFAYGGWHMVTYAAGETRNAGRTLPRALMAGTVLVTVCYMLLNGAYLYVMPVNVLAGSPRVASEATQRALGAAAGGAISLLVVISALGALNGIILAGPRVYYAMAQDRLAFRWLGALDPRRKTPHLAIAAQAFWSSLLVLTSSYRELFTRVVYTEWMFFALLAVGLFVLRRKGWRPIYLGRAFPVAPLLFIAASAGIAINQIRMNSRDSIIGLGLLLLGVPVYFLTAKARN
ncbi:MAG TPA: amino acid permease [Candidatus Acidoferrales bacterium]|jgi:APA family basic amino acid/polyamine antiporter|nr:amino acid permease [Candidatus Acidoferrales bacterium]